MVWRAVVRCSILQKWSDRFVSIFCESKRCRGMNLSRSILNGHSCECCCGATERLLLVCEWCMSERIWFQRAEWCTVSDSIHFSINTSATLHLKVVHCGLFSRVFSSCFFCISVETPHPKTRQTVSSWSAMNS